MFKELRPAFVLATALIVLTGLVYPLAMTGLANAAFPYQAQGSLVLRDGKIVGSALIGQEFVGDGYFRGRPSATTTADPADPTKSVPAPYNAAASGGSNLGPTSQALVDRVKEDLEKLKAGNPNVPPIDLVTTSASGLDPHISPDAAFFQVPRVAKARDLPETRIRELVANAVEGRLLGFLGEPRVNVLLLNLALDRVAAK